MLAQSTYLVQQATADATLDAEVLTAGTSLKQISSHLRLSSRLLPPRS